MGPKKAGVQCIDILFIYDMCNCWCGVLHVRSHRVYWSVAVSMESNNKQDEKKNHLLVCMCILYTYGVLDVSNSRDTVRARSDSK